MAGGAWVALAVAGWCVAAAAADDAFIWGTATASYQIEGGTTKGGRGASIWDTFCTSPPYKCHLNETGEPADNAYELFDDDAVEMARMGVSHYRMSFAWPRILPDGVTVSQAGLDHYRRVLASLKRRGVTPLVTLYHWDLPQAVYIITRGGWTNSTIVEYYMIYARTVFEAFSDDVDFWLTFNEPLTFCRQGYDSGTHAPGRCSDRAKCPAGGNSATEPYLCAHHVLLSHAAAVKEFRARGYAGKIGITLNTDFAAPASAAAEDVAAAERHLVFQAAWYADPVWFGDYPQEMKDLVGDRLPAFTAEQRVDLKGSWDFYGLNHYTTKWLKAGGENDEQTSESPANQYNGTVIGKPAASPWLYVVPWGIGAMLRWVSVRYGNPPIYVTENGCDVPGENDMPLATALRDTFRVDYYKGYTASVLDARTAGVDVRGYFAWSFMDNFEWADGYAFRFGLHYVDYASPGFTRYAKDSAKWYAGFIQEQRRA